MLIAAGWTMEGPDTMVVPDLLVILMMFRETFGATMASSGMNPRKRLAAF